MKRHSRIRQFAVLIAFAFVTIWLASCHNSLPYRDVDTDTFLSLIESDSIVLLDVRTPQEYEKGHLKGALLLNFRDSTFLQRAQYELDPRYTIAVYCKSGGRSSAAATLLTKEGFRVINLKGGLQQLKNDSILISMP